ncbi:hypothetical protein N0K08_17295 [Acidovorax sp. Be4]|uniref:ParB/Sulfiredoxin domain-containing protein n=1 Tax=Acidovorax bellezanensis TaxID=2976702 RepID=A0ABT2PRA8_9BURK|nr:hypothetical protein [Acidovorax sp. Be4]MCT9812401.1 hypothetical protein [Acidovorax sp. Be4]
MIKKVSTEYFKISAKNIHLDSDNPRHDYKSRESEIIRALCNDKLVALAKDIAEMESLSPLEIIGVVPSEDTKGHYIALEGNRRTCALLLLADPGRAPDTAFKERFERIAKSRNVPKELNTYIFSDRKAAQPWLDRRHMGTQDGVGTDGWDAEAKARRASKDNAEKSTAHANILALAVVDRLIGIGRIDDQQKKQIKITTLARYLNSKSRQTIIGIGGLSNNNHLIYTHNPYIIDGILEKFSLDSIPTSKNERAIVHSRADARECLNYLLDIARNKFPPETKLSQPIEILSNTPTSAPPNPKPSSIGGSSNYSTSNSNNTGATNSFGPQLNQEEQKNPYNTDYAQQHATALSTALMSNGSDETTVIDPAPSTENEDSDLFNAFTADPESQPTVSSANETYGGTSSVRSVKDRSERNKVLESRFLVKIDDKILIKLRKEMLITETDEHEFAANYLLRAFVERILVLYYRRTNSTRKYGNDLELVQRCAQDSKAAEAPRNVQDILNQASTNSHVAHSLYTLGTGIHGGTIPNKRQLNGVFDTWEPALRYMLDAIPVSTSPIP